MDGSSTVRPARWIPRTMLLLPLILQSSLGCMLNGQRGSAGPVVQASKIKVVAVDEPAVDEPAGLEHRAHFGNPVLQERIAEEPTTLVRHTIVNADTQPKPMSKTVPPGGKKPDAAPPDSSTAESAPENALRLDFDSVLSRSLGASLHVAGARERINEAYARQLGARTLWLPTLRAGVSYNRHEGTIQDVAGKVFGTNRASLNSGFGSSAVGAGSPAVPGLSARFHLRDALFEPRIAQAEIAAENQAATAAVNDTLLAVSLAYLDLLAAEQNRAIAAGIATKAKELADLTAAYAKSGEGAPADADRARTEWMLRRNDIHRADERVASASARLREWMRLDQETSLIPLEPAVVPLELVPADLPLRELIATGLTNRPELAESRSLVVAAAEKLRSDRCSPWIPSLMFGVSQGWLGGSKGTAIDNFGGRLDMDVGAYWEIRSFGFGEKAIRDRSRARLEQARLRELRRMDQVAREVADHHAQAGFRKKQITIAQEGVESATASLRRNLERIRERQGLPLEVLQSIQALDLAQREYLRALVEYNQAQFRLQWALGWSGLRP